MADNAGYFGGADIDLPMVRSSPNDSVSPIPLGSTDNRLSLSEVLPSLMREESTSAQSAADVAAIDAAKHQASPQLDAQSANQRSKAAGGPDNLFAAPVSQAVADVMI